MYRLGIGTWNSIFLAIVEWILLRFRSPCGDWNPPNELKNTTKSLNRLQFFYQNMYNDYIKHF